jgi:hypothetical protein
LLVLTALHSSGCRPTCDPPDWTRKDAYRCCATVIDRAPAAAPPPCAALHLCANEAQLTASQQAKLTGMMSALGCEAP